MPGSTMTKWNNYFVFWTTLCFAYAKSTHQSLPSDSGRVCSCSGVFRRKLDCSNRERSIFSPKELCAGRTTEINLSCNFFTAFPESIGRYVVKVNISDNFLSTIPRVPPLNQKSLLIDLSDNHISYATDELRNLSSLETLDISENLLKTLSFLPKPCALRELRAQKNNIRSLNGPLRHCSELLSLDLSYNQLGTLQVGMLSELTNLKYLVLHRTGLLNIASGAFDKLQKLELLNLSENKLTVLPSGSFLSLVNLKQLFLDNNNVTSLLDGIFKGLKNLEILSLSRNKLNILPQTLFQDLVNLRYLILNENELKSLPERIFSGLSKLKSVNLGNNRLEMLPSFLFTGLNFIESIAFYGNHLKSLPADLLSGITSLDFLDFGNNTLQTVPTGLFQSIKSIKVLNLSSNHLRFVRGQDFTGLKYITLLDLTKNHITKLPTYDGSWPSISYVDLEYNEIADISEASLRSWLEFNDEKRVLMMGSKLSPRALVGLRWTLHARGHTTHMGPDCACGGLQRGNAEVQFCVAISCPGAFASWLEAVNYS